MRRFTVARTLFSLGFAVFVSAIPAALAVYGARGSQLNPCAAPNEIGSSFEETAWQIWHLFLEVCITQIGISDDRRLKAAGSYLGNVGKLEARLCAIS